MVSATQLLTAIALLQQSCAHPYPHPQPQPQPGLVVTSVPEYVRSYVVRAYSLDAVLVGPQAYRFPVNNASSGGAFTLISTAAPASDELGVLPHIHKTHYENFFCLRGRFQLWAQKDGEQQARQFTPGDYGAVPQNTTHTFQLLDPINEMVGVIAPGGFEKLFYELASRNFSSVIHAPFPPTFPAASPGSNTSVISALEALDVFAQLDFVPRRDLVNGTAPTTEAWHSGSNALAENSSALFSVAKGRGPQYITGASGFWQIISPFITPLQSAGMFTQGTLTLSRRFNESAPVASHIVPTHTALEVLEGVLSVSLQGETLPLTTGDVLFVAADTKFAYWTEAAYTTALYVGGGSATLDQKLLESAPQLVTSAVYMQSDGFNISVHQQCRFGGNVKFVGSQTNEAKSKVFDIVIHISKKTHV